jgi:two-component system, response regulator PdtaR
MTPDPNPEPAAACILVVEDVVLVRANIAAELREAGFSVLEAASAEDALSYFRAEVKVDLVFTDIQLSGSSLDGLRMAQQLRSEYADLPIVLTSGNHLPGPDVEHFVPKPYDVQRVILLIIELLAGTQGPG